MVLGAGEAFTNNGTLTAGKGNSVFSAQRLFLNAPGSLQGGGDVSLNSRSDITISGFTGTAGSLTMNVAGTLLNSALDVYKRQEYILCTQNPFSHLMVTDV